MAENKAGLAAALLDAHVDYVVEELSGAGLTALIDEEVDAALLMAGKLTVGAVVSRKQIKDTARVFAAKVEFGPGLPELVGDIARKLFDEAVHDKTSIEALLTDAHFEEFVDQALELKALREQIIRTLVTSPLYTDLAADLLYGGITGYLAQNNVAKNIPGAASMFKLGRAALNVAKPTLESSLEEGLRKYIAKAVAASQQRSASFLIDHADAETLKELALDGWERIKHQPLGSVREHIDARAVEELFVTGFEAWRHLRQQHWYTAMIDAGVDGFFDKYEDTTLAALLEDLGISRRHMVDEARRYAPSVIKVLKKKKLLEPIVRRRLAGFYGSPVLQAVLDKASG
jgi:hypothetical protein